MYLFRRRPAESLIRMACSLRSTRLQGRARKGGAREGEMVEREKKEKGLAPGEGRSKKRKRREREREEAEGGGMIGRGRTLTVWACKMAYGGLSI